MAGNIPQIVCETHADDAFLSMGQHLEDWHKQRIPTAIVTVFSGTRKRAVDAQKYADAVGAKWEGWGFVEGEPLPNDLSMYLQNSKISLFPFSESVEWYINLALTHPEHKRVRELLEPAAAGMYVDQPYAITQKNAPIVTELMKGRTVLSYKHPGKRKYRHIPLFKDQSKFFYFNNEEKLLQTFEMIVQ